MMFTLSICVYCSTILRPFSVAYCGIGMNSLQFVNDTCIASGRWLEPSLNGLRKLQLMNQLGDILESDSEHLYTNKQIDSQASNLQHIEKKHLSNK